MLSTFTCHVYMYVPQSGKATTLTQMVLTFDPRDPLLLCCVLRCMLSGLIWLLDLDTATLLQPYLQKVVHCTYMYMPRI